MLRSFDPSLELEELKLHIAKPNKRIIGELSEAIAKRYNSKLGNISEINFTLPYKIEVRHNLIDNPNIDKIRDRFLIKAEYNGKDEWYRISNINTTGAEKDLMEVTALSLGIELSDKSIRDIKEVSKNAEEMMKIALRRTSWGIGTIHPDFLDVKRGFEIPDTTRLDLIFRIAEAFRGIIVWNTEDRTIDLHTDDSLARNRGLSFSHGKYIKSISEDRDSNEMVTRLIPHGKNGLTIHKESITGEGHIDDFSFFLYPFYRDKSRKVISSSNYMSDDLAHAILDYTELLRDQEGEYDRIIGVEKKLNTQSGKKEDQISALSAELGRIRDLIDLKLSEIDGDATTLQETRNSLIDQIAISEEEYDHILVQIKASQAEKDALQVTLSLDENFTEEEQIELNDSYIIEKHWTNEHIDLAEDLLKEAREEFKILRSPETIFTLSIINFMLSLESQRDWGKLHLGDIVTIQYEQLGISVTAKIIEFTIDFDGNDIDLTIANTADILDAEGRFFKDLYNFSSSTSIVNSQKNKWDKIDGKVTNMDEIINGKLDAVKRGIIAGVNNTITIDGRGIRIRDNDDPDVFLVAQNSVLAITNNGGETWDHAITPTGIVGERVYGKLLAGSRLVIDASDDEGEKTFTIDGRGVRIRGSSLQILGGLADSEIESSKDWNEKAEQEDIDKVVGDVEQSLSDLDDLLYGAFKDGIISESEAKAIEKHINNLNVDKEEVDSKYIVVYMNPDLLGKPKTDLLHAKINYNGTHDKLISTIREVIKDGKVTLVDIAKVDLNFELYRKSMGLLTKAFEHAVDSIAQRKADKVQDDIDKNRDRWDRASFINPDGTLNSARLKGLLTDEQLASAKKWNGQGTYIDQFGVYTGVVIAEKIIGGTIHTDRISIGWGSTYENGYDPSTKETPAGAQAKADAVKKFVDTNKVNWDRASFINSDGTFNSNSLKGSLTDGQLASAKRWNGQGVWIDPTGIYTGSLVASQIIAGRIKADYITIGMNTSFGAGYNPSEKETPAGAQSKVDVVGNIISSNKFNWDRASFINANGTLNVGQLSGKLTDAQLHSAQRWNGQGVHIDHTGVYTGNLIASQIISGKINADYINVNSITIRDANITGTLTSSKLNLDNTLKDTNVNNNFIIDRFGNVTIKGNVTMTSGTISWGSVSTPSAAQIGAKPNSYSAYDDIGRNRLTEIRSDGLYTGSLSAVTGYFSGELRGGSITSNTSINVSTFITVGNQISIGSMSDNSTKRLRFSNGSVITSSGANFATLRVSTNTLELQGSSSVNILTSSFRVNGTSLPTASSGTVYNASRLGGGLASTYVRSFGGYQVGFEVTSNGNLNIYRNNSYFKTIDL